jgi:hypothetical protein
MKKVILLLVIGLVSCKEEPKFNFNDHIPVDIKILQEKVKEFELMPNMEEEVDAMKNNIAIAKENILSTIVMKYETEYMNKHSESVPEEELVEFKNKIKYDSLMYVFELDIIRQ